MLKTRDRQIAAVAGLIVLLLALGLIGAYVGGEGTRERAALAEATPEGPPVESLHDCPWGDASCVLALGIERALQRGAIDSVMEFTEPRTYVCPGGEPAPGGPFPLCDGLAEFESREGFPLVFRYGDSEVVDRDYLERVVSNFVERVHPETEDEFGSGELRLHAFGCPERAVPFQNVGCARLAIVFTAILSHPSNTKRELLIFWAVGNYRGRTLPVTEIWRSDIPLDEAVVLFEGGRLPDLGEIYVIDQSLRGESASGTDR